MSHARNSSPSRYSQIRLALSLATVLGISASAQAQLKVTNGDFSNLTGMTEGNGGWYSGLPKGWSGSGNTYAINAAGPAPPTCNPSTLGFFRQNVGTLPRTSDVTLTFDVSEPWKAPAVLTAAILDGTFVELAAGDFSAGAKQTLVAKGVPGGTSIIVSFGAANLTPGLDNVSVAVRELAPCEQAAAKPPVTPDAPVTVACYYFGNYHPGDPRNEKNKGPGWSEWELVKAARPRFPGHQQPKVPLWGYTDESDPKAMAQKIDAAADHGVDAFIFDWYYYNDGPFLDRPIDLGFLKAENNARLKFAFMWANHDWLELHPYHRGAERKVLYPGTVTPKNFEKICDHVIRSYFQHPSYWRIDGRPYFSFYELTKLLGGFGSVDATRSALDKFRAKAVAAGLPGLHLNAVVWGQPILPGEQKPTDPDKLVEDLGFDSVTSYVWIHHVPLPNIRTDYNEVRNTYFNYWNEAERKFSMPYFPNVTMGWDSSPRAHQDDEFGNFGYPFMNTIGGNTPERFKEALEMTKRRLVSKPGGPRILNINCWNEWTEGSYLEPDLINGMKYLEAIRDVFPAAKE
jgi:glycosyl transferase family WbsX